MPYIQVNHLMSSEIVSMEGEVKARQLARCKSTTSFTTRATKVSMYIDYNRGQKLLAQNRLFQIFDNIAISS